MIAIIDYEAGNLASVRRALRFLGHPSTITSEADEIRAADRVVFPGVGAAGEAMRQLRESGLGDVVRDVIAAGTPFLGICLGYQVLFEHSDENDVDCLSVFPGRVVRFPDDLHDAKGRGPLKVPEMGWNEVRFKGDHPLWNEVPEGSEFYFVHSFYPSPKDDVVCATTTYGIEYACGVTQKNVVAFQFHPEKSGRPGLRLLKNFCEWVPGKTD
ncbi:MAG: imidazole glycerol phosphate synthase subunit HisH [Candidatus Pacebacteria bacterium]|nr:imidazole glycerol phosphate synthase subunit HisH [Candidatus Paceibacterota bacterium]